MERILVTGGAGYVGSACVAQLLSRGFSVDVVDDLSTGHTDAVPVGASLHQLDVGNRAALSSLLTARRYDVVFHFAGKHLIPESVTNPGPFVDVNEAGGIAMLEMLRQHCVRQFVLSSSAPV